MDVAALLKQAKKMQKELNKVEAELKTREYTSSVGGGVVKVNVNGNTQITAIEIDSSLLTAENKDELQDMVVMAVNDALFKMSEDKEKTMNEMTGGIKMPGVF